MYQNLSDRSDLHDRQFEALEGLHAARVGGDPASIQAAEHLLIERFLSLAETIGGRYRRRSSDIDDIMQVARMGLVKAVRRWDPSKGDCFEQFAVPTIQGEIKRYFRDQSLPIRMPRSLYGIEQAAAAATEDLHQQLGRAPREDEVAGASGVKVISLRAQRMATAACHPESMDHPANQHLVACLPSSDADADLAGVDSRMALQTAIGDLSAAEQRILGLAYFSDYTQTQIGRSIGVSQMQVSRLHRHALDKLRLRMTG